MTPIDLLQRRSRTMFHASHLYLLFKAPNSSFKDGCYLPGREGWFSETALSSPPPYSGAF